MPHLLLLLTACTAGDDTGAVPTDDTGAVTPVSLDAVLAGAPDGSWSCRWAYLAAVRGEYTLVADLVLPEADRYANQDVSYVRGLEASDALSVGGGPGTDELQIFDCSDVMEIPTDIHVWRATAATLSIDAVFVEDHPEWTCSGTDPNPLYDAQVSITDAVFEDSAGAIATLDAWGPFPFQIGADRCGG